MVKTKINLLTDYKGKFATIEAIQDFISTSIALINTSNSQNYFNAEFFRNCTDTEREYVKTLLNEIKDNARVLNSSANYWSKNIKNKIEGSVKNIDKN